MNNISTKVLEFVQQCRLNADDWKFASTPGGPETLYASSFACMLYHYLGQLNNLTATQKQNWANYINSWQDPKTGLFLGPELEEGNLQSTKHSPEHLAHHLLAHVLPALEILGAKPSCPLHFGHQFLDLNFLDKWLAERDWKKVWLEGNNLLFVGQFLIFLRDKEMISSASEALDAYFSWLDKEIDPNTGLWGTNGYCGLEAGLYGGYHQLLVYYYENHPITSPERLVDIALSMQNSDGSFDPSGRGSACQDIDAIDILVNLYKLENYRRPQIRLALRKAVKQVLNMQMPDGGFVNRLNEPFTHMGMQSTSSAKNQSNMFPTWFRVHSLAVISEILTDEDIAKFDWKFNPSLSMGWHRSWKNSVPKIGWREHFLEAAILTKRKMSKQIYKISG